MALKAKMVLLVVYLAAYVVASSASVYAAAMPRRDSDVTAMDDVESVALLPEAIECFFCEQPIDRRFPFFSLARREIELYYHPQCLVFPEGTITLSCCGRELAIAELYIEKMYEDSYIDVYVRCPFCKREIIHKGSPKSCKTLCKNAPRDCIKGMAYGLGMCVILGIVYVATLLNGSEGK